jgi:hypothetical protein
MTEKNRSVEQPESASSELSEQGLEQVAGGGSPLSTGTAGMDD